jgi:protein phosphatase
MLARNPDIDLATLRAHPMRNALTNVLGSRPRVDVHVAERTLDPGDLLVLTTDGVHGVLDERDLVVACEGGGDLQAYAAGLVRAAIGHGSRDNCTAVVARYDGC